MEIFEIEPSNKGKYIAAAAFQKDIQVWNMQDFSKVAQLKTHFEYGGKRATVSDDGRYCAAAAYGRYGVSLYDTESGKEIWTNKNIKHIQKIGFTQNDEALYVENGDNELYTLDLQNGNIINRQNGMRIRTEQSVLAVCDVPKGMVYSVMGGGICCCMNNGKKLWKGYNRAGEHFVKLSYSEKYHQVCGIAFQYEEPREEPFYILCCYDAETGKLKYQYDLDQGNDFAFIREGECIISSTGTVFQLSDSGAAVSEMFCKWE